MSTWPSLRPEAAWTRLEAPREAERQFCLGEVGCSVITLAPEPACPASAVRVLQDHRRGEAHGPGPGPGRQPPASGALGGVHLAQSFCPGQGFQPPRRPGVSAARSTPHTP